MKLTELNPKFLFHGGDGVRNSKTGEPIPEREGVGITFDCPCGGKCGQRAILNFENPIDDGEQVAKEQPAWKRTGEDFESMSLTPSIRRMAGCKWHGYLTNGEFKACSDSGR